MIGLLLLKHITVQPKAITFPTDAKLLHAAIKGLNRLASRHGVRLRQSYLRIAKRAAMMAGRYAHAKQFIATVANCASCAPGSSASSAISDAGSWARPSSRQPSLGHCRAPHKSARSNSATASARLEAVFVPRPGGGMHLQGQGQRAL